MRIVQITRSRFAAPPPCSGKRLLQRVFIGLLIGFGQGSPPVFAETLLPSGNLSLIPAAPTIEAGVPDAPTPERLNPLQSPAHGTPSPRTPEGFSSPHPAQNRFDQAVTSATQRPFQWDLGSDLPLPTEADERLGPNHKDVGFHIGLDFYPNKLWEFSGVAGVKINNGPVNIPVTPKPSMDQVGVEAKMHF